MYIRTIFLFGGEASVLFSEESSLSICIFNGKELRSACWGTTGIENIDDDIYPEWILFSSITFFKFSLTSVKLVIDLQRCEYGLELKKTDFLFVLI